MAVGALELVKWPTADEGQEKIIAGKYCASKGYGGPVGGIQKGGDRIGKDQEKHHYGDGSGGLWME